MLKHPVFETVYIGGGTPSILPPELMARLLKGLHQRLNIAPDAEFSCEANPGTLTTAWLETAVSGEINRLSMGVQAFQPRLLKMLGRIHTAEQAVESVRLAREMGISNLNLDLMFGLPGQTEADWRESLSCALALEPQHLSCYGLIPEEGTPLFEKLERGELTLPEEETERAMYDMTLNMLGAAGFRQYEISNFARPGYECKHNLGYWRQVPYLGIGPSAASMLPDPEGKCSCIRTANPPEIEAWLNGQSGTIEKISAEEARFETLMLGLRTTEGVSADEFEKMHGVSLQACYGERLERQRAFGLMEHSRGRWYLTRRGMDVQNAVLVDLMD